MLDAVNAIIYAMEGDIDMAIISLICTILIVGSLIGLPIKYAMRYGVDVGTAFMKFGIRNAPEITEGVSRLARAMKSKYDDASAWVSKKFEKITPDGDDFNNTNVRIIIDGLKDADIIYKENPLTGKLEPYMKQFQVNDDYKVLMRRDFDGFNNHDPNGNHWNLEVQTTGGRTVYDMHIYLDEDGNILPISDDNIYIPRKSPFNEK